MKSIYTLFLLSLVLLSCQQEKPLTAQEIVDRSIEVSGGTLFNQSEISFSFRGRKYDLKRPENGGRRLSRTTIDTTGKRTKDIIVGSGIKRLVNDSLVRVPDSMGIRFANSVNSVHYFAYLPQGLNDQAVNKELLGEVTIKDIPYYKLRIHFNQEGGGTDFEDVFVYWINKESFEIDYLAYEFHVDGGGVRFREAFNERYVEGLRFVDYNNSKPKDASVKVEDLDKTFKEDGLQLLSKIELEDVQVRRK